MDGSRQGFLSKGSLKKRLVRTTVVSVLLGAAFVSISVAVTSAFLPPPQALPQVDILFQDGRLLSKRSLDEKGHFMGPHIRGHEIPAHVRDAIIALEDRRFFHHFGIDPIGVVRAAVANAISGQTSQGGSTITQQLARTLFLSNRRSWSRKAKEALLALTMELRWGKLTIFELYVNRIYFGHDALGLSAAAKLYFGKVPADLTLPEAAMIAGLIQAPERLSPINDLRAARKRAVHVLSAMVECRLVTPGVAETARTRLRLTAPKAHALLGEYVADAAIAELRDKLSSVALHATRLTVRTTVERDLQVIAQRAVLSHVDRYGERRSFNAASLLAVSPDGAVRAMVGGTDYRETRFNLALRARRQPGSSFKPFVFLAALEAGYKPEDRVLDAPDHSRDWFPQNASRAYSGRFVTLTEGLARSLNSVSARLTYAVTPRRVITVAKRLGVGSAIADNPTIALGTSEVTITEMAIAYAAFANGGLKAEKRILDNVVDQTGRILYRSATPKPQRVVARREVTLMNGMLREVMQQGTGSGALVPGHDVAGKSGTTQANRDAWFIGFNSTLVTAVWLGNMEGESMRSVAGGQLPAAIWAVFMREALRHAPPRVLPGDLIASGR